MLSCFSHRFIWTPTRKTPDPKVHFVQSLGQKPVEQLSGLLNLIDFFIVIVFLASDTFLSVAPGTADAQHI